jgi:uncharacterized protein YpmS
MNNLPTVEEFMTDEYQIKHYGTILMKPNQSAIEFAKLHAEAALKAAHKNMQLSEEDLEFTLDAYPLTNIK